MRLLLAGLLLLGGCEVSQRGQAYKPKFIVGDCIQWQQPVERWASPNIIYEIKEVGANHYRMEYGHGLETQWSFFITNDEFERVKCPGRNK